MTEDDTYDEDDYGCEYRRNGGELVDYVCPVCDAEYGADGE